MQIKNILIAASSAVVLWGCTAHGDNPGREYAPNMYHSVAYEPLSQITDESAGRWVNSLDNGANRGEYFNSNKYNPNRMNMRMPAPNTVKRNQFGWLPYRSKKVAKDSIDFIVGGMKNPLDSTAAIVDAGKVLYEVDCKHCHGAKGMGDGKVADKFPGVANLKGDSYLGMSEGHIFHVITYGAGLMGSHGSQISPEDRWKIAKYVKVLQKQK
ncbi:MAG: cytochrome c [Cyclobacteriaceae bacterium]|nr:cytochrome c [Cyclobacteriaceae bacterium]